MQIVWLMRDQGQQAQVNSSQQLYLPYLDIVASPALQELKSRKGKVFAKRDGLYSTRPSSVKIGEKQIFS